MNLSMSRLFLLTGRYSGKGKNHEGQPFTGTLEIKPPTIEKGLAFSFEAIGEDKQSFHRESSR